MVHSTLKPSTTFFFLVFLGMISWSVQLRAADDEIKLQADAYLHLGNFQVMMPACHGQKNLDGETFGASDLLKFDYLVMDKMKPAEGEQINWNDKIYEWETQKAAKDGFVFPERKVKKDIYQIAYLAAWIETDRWMKVDLKVTSPQMFEVYLDHENVKTKTSVQGEDEDPENVTIHMKLEKGKHLLIFKTLKTADNEGDWKLKTEMSYDSTFAESKTSFSLSPTRQMTIRDLLDGEFVNGADVSADGQLVMLKYSITSPPKGNRESWAEIRNLETGELIQSFREANMHSMEWLPRSRAISYETSNKEKGASLWVFDFDSMTIKEILSGKKDFGSYTWAPDENFVIYTINEEPKEDDGDLKRFEGMPDRWPWWRNRSFLYQLDIASGVSERLTWGHLTTGLMDIRPDGQKILFSQSIPDFSERPYSRQYLMEMDLQTRQVDTIWEKRFSGNCSYAPDGVHLLVTGSPEVFGNAGVNVTGDVIPNDYDNQAYIFDPSSGDVDPITFNFNPSIDQAIWSKYDPNQIYFLASDRTYKNIFIYDLNRRYFKEIDSGFDVVNSMSPAENFPVIVCTGSGISTPSYAAAIHPETGEVSIIANPRQEAYQNVEFGKTAEWNFTNRNGVEIEGRIYFPPDFDKKKEYPLIVYYYGGTSPTERSFGGRYPKNLFAAQGYVVYNLQPSGATGYGQDFSAAHVNNWGITVADEIIEGTKKFIEDHDFIDKDKVGCIGASYGGFMTMLLQTRTDIFAAAISHAGISSIAGYWGEGYWGYLYSSVASANSFPWNNEKLYVKQSALFNADKITTPLLLLHGSVDTNVPPGESIQLYTALKLLGRPVELIEIEGQNHHIVDYKKRIEWQNTIFAWFDKWLKDQPQWWNELYPERNL